MRWSWPFSLAEITPAHALCECVVSFLFCLFSVSEGQWMPHLWSKMLCLPAQLHSSVTLAGSPSDAATDSFGSCLFLCVCVCECVCVCQSQEGHSSLVFSMEAVSCTWLWACVCVCVCVCAARSVSLVDMHVCCKNNLLVGCIMSWLSSICSFISAQSISFPFPDRHACTWTNTLSCVCLFVSWACRIHCCKPCSPEWMDDVLALFSLLPLSELHLEVFLKLIDLQWGMFWVIQTHTIFPLVFLCVFFSFPQCFLLAEKDSRENNYLRNFFLFFFSISFFLLFKIYKCLFSQYHFSEMLTTKWFEKWSPKDVPHFVFIPVFVPDHLQIIPAEVFSFVWTQPGLFLASFRAFLCSSSFIVHF